QPVALLAEEELAIPNADVHVDHVSVLEQVDHAIDATGLRESAREETVAAARDGQKRHGPPEGGHGGSLQRPVAANADQERAARAAPRRPATQAARIGKRLQHGPMSARAKLLAQPGSRVEGAVVPGGRRRDDLDGARLARECASPYCSHGRVWACARRSHRWEEPRAARAARDEHREFVSPDRSKRGARLLRASTAREARTDDARLRSQQTPRREKLHGKVYTASSTSGQLI